MAPSTLQPQECKHFPPTACSNFVTKSLIVNSLFWVLDDALQAHQMAGIEPFEWPSSPFSDARAPYRQGEFWVFPGHLLPLMSVCRNTLPRLSRKPASEILSRLSPRIGLPALDLRKVSTRIAQSTLLSSSSNLTLLSLSFAALISSDVETEPLPHVSSSLRCPTIPVSRQMTVVPPSSAWWPNIISNSATLTIRA